MQLMGFRCWLYTTRPRSDQKRPREEVGTWTLLSKACGDLDQRFGVTVANDSAICCTINLNEVLEVSLKPRTLGSLDDEGMLTDLGRKMAECSPESYSWGDSTQIWYQHVRCTCVVHEDSWGLRFPMEPALSKMLLTSVDLRWNPQKTVPSRNWDHCRPWYSPYYGIRLTLITRFAACNLYVGVVTRSWQLLPCPELSDEFFEVAQFPQWPYRPSGDVYPGWGHSLPQIPFIYIYILYFHTLLLLCKVLLRRHMLRAIKVQTVTLIDLASLSNRLTEKSIFQALSTECLLPTKGQAGPNNQSDRVLHLGEETQRDATGTIH